MSIFPSFSSTGNRVSYCTQTNKTGGRCSAEPPPAPSERRSHSHARDRKSPHPPGAGRRAVPQEKHGGYRLRQAQREEARGGCRGSGGSGGGVSAPAGRRRRREHGVPSGRHDPQLHGSAAHRQRHRHRGERAERPGLLHPVLRLHMLCYFNIYNYSKQHLIFYNKYPSVDSPAKTANNPANE